MSANPPDPYARAVSEMTGGFGQLNSEFQQKFGRPLRVTAGQNAEHQKLHPSGAWDIGGSDLKPDEGNFITSRAPQLGLNVSDYRKAAPHTTNTGVKITGPHIHLDMDSGDDPYANAVQEVSQPSRVQGLLSSLKAANPQGMAQSPVQKRRTWNPPTQQAQSSDVDKLFKYVQQPPESPAALEQRTMTRARQLVPPKPQFAGRAPSGLERFTGGLSDVVSGMAQFPVGIAEIAVKSLLGKPAQTGQELWNMLGAPQLAEYQKAQSLARQKGYKDGRAALSDPEVAAHFTAAFLPMVGPMAAHAGERIGSGDIAGGLGEAVGVLAPMVAHGIRGEQVTGKVADLPEDPYAKPIAEVQGERNVSSGVSEVQPLRAENVGPVSGGPTEAPVLQKPKRAPQATQAIVPEVKAAPEVSKQELTRVFTGDVPAFTKAEPTPTAKPQEPAGVIQQSDLSREPQVSAVPSETPKMESPAETKPAPQGEQKERSLPKTLEEANLPGGENRTYTATSNEANLAAADKVIAEKGVNGAAEWVKGENEPSAIHTTTAIRVIGELQKAGKYDEAVNVASDLSEKLTRQGQAIQAVQVLNELSPERALMVAERMAKRNKTKLNPEVITEKATIAKADDARLKFLESEVERLTAESQKTAPKKAPKGLTGRLSERSQAALAQLQGHKIDLSGISQGSELGAVTVGKPPLQGDAELLAEYGASTLNRPMADWRADMQTRFGQIPDAQLDTIARRAYDIRSEERVNDLAERMASAETKRSAGSEIAQSIRDAEKAARQAENAAAKAKRQQAVQGADVATRDARAQAKQQADAVAEDARQKLADARREGIEAKRQADRLERERIASEKAVAKQNAQWTAPFKQAADEARSRRTDQPASLEDATAIAADIISPERPQESVRRGLNASQAYRRIIAQTGVDAKTARQAYRQAYQRVSDARTAARESARISAATGGQAGALTDAQLQSVLAQREAAQRDANRSRQDLASEFQKLQMTTGQRIMHNFVRGGRQVMLSGITTVEKLGAFGAVEQVMTPLRDLTGGILKQIPGVKTVAAQAPREGGGFNTRAQAAGIAKYLRTVVETFAPGKSDVRSYLKTGHSDIDVKYGKADSLPPEVTESFGRLHGALKLPTKLAEFERASRIRLEHAIGQGLDPTDPMVVANAMEGAYMDANRSIMLADNMISDAFNSVKSNLRRGGHPYAAMGMEFMLPITKVPVNIVAETGRYSPAGALKSVGEILYHGIRGTLNELEPNQADRIMRNLKKGTLGTALYAIAYALPNVIQLGGYKKKGEKEEDLPVKPETMNVFGVDIGKQWIHHPVFETMQSMQTLRRLHDEYGYTDASLTAAKQNLEHVPYLEEPSKALEAFGSPDAMRNFVGALIRSRIEPPDLQRAARIGDQPDTTPGSKRAQFFGLTPEARATRRYPETLAEQMKMGIPGQRETVPAVSVPRTFSTPNQQFVLSSKQHDELRKATAESVNQVTEAIKPRLADLPLSQRLAASKYITNQIIARERDRVKLKLDKEFADSKAGDQAFDRIQQPLEDIIFEAREKVTEGKFNKKPRTVAQ